MKMKHNYKVLGIAILTFFLCVLSLFKLPDTIPIHWNVQGEIDGYGSKYLILLFGLLGLGVYCLMNLTKKMDPFETKIDEKLETYLLMRDLMTVMLSAVGLIFLVALFYPTFNLMMGISIVLGIGLVLIGNYMPRVPHNYYLGAKTPWAIANEDNWKVTQRLGGYVLCMSGGVMVLGGIIGQTEVMSSSIIVLILGIIYVYYKSWRMFKDGNV